MILPRQAAGRALAVLSCVGVMGCASKTLPPDSLVLNGTAPTISVRRHIDTKTALISVHRIPDTAGKTVHIVEVMSFITTDPLPEGDFDLARAFVRLACEGISDAELDVAFGTSGAGGYYRFADLPCDVVVNPPFGPTWVSKA